MVADYSIDGLRVDSAQQTGVNFFPSFQNAGMLACFVFLCFLVPWVKSEGGGRERENICEKW